MKTGLLEKPREKKIEQNRIALLLSFHTFIASALPSSIKLKCEALATGADHR
jgi:hypothetical protein